jgi:hypothetical protein
MKRLFQPVAVLLVSLVAAQPALAGILCAAPAAPCPMAITDMGPSCGLASQVAAGASQQTGRIQAIPRSMASVALPAASKATAPAALDSPFEALPAPRPSLLAIGQAPGESSSPPIYIRNRVFRI